MPENLIYIASSLRSIANTLPAKTFSKVTTDILGPCRRMPARIHGDSSGILPWQIHKIVYHSAGNSPGYVLPQNAEIHIYAQIALGMSLGNRYS